MIWNVLWLLNILLLGRGFFFLHIFVTFTLQQKFKWFSLLHRCALFRFLCIYTFRLFFLFSFRRMKWNMRKLIHNNHIHLWMEMCVCVHVFHLLKLKAFLEIGDDSTGNYRMKWRKKTKYEKKKKLFNLQNESLSVLISNNNFVAFLHFCDRGLFICCFFFHWGKSYSHE